MRILVFDVDGTLTRTNRVDGAFFEAALRDVFPSFDRVDLDESSEATDTAILHELCAESGESYEDVMPRVLAHFLDGLEGAARTDPGAFLPVPGARNVFDRARTASWTPAIATGGWRPSAELKLRTAGIPFDGVPLSTSTESRRRVDIIRRAVEEASGGSTPDEVVYVGDGPWDVRACQELSIGFIGVGKNEAMDRLLSLGASVVLPDLQELPIDDPHLSASSLVPGSGGAQ